MAEVIKKYSKEGFSVVWKPQKCIHSARCFRGLPSVFDPRKRPWVDMNGADINEIIRQVGDCPSGALSITEEDITAKQDEEIPEVTEIHVSKKGPLIVHGNCLVVDENGLEVFNEEKTALCRCGGSSNKPYCDGTHNKLDVL